MGLGDEFEDVVRKTGSIGVPNFHMDARIVDDEGRQLGLALVCPGQAVHGIVEPGLDVDPGGGDSLFAAQDVENLTIRGYGATLKNMAGEKFMNRYDSRGSLAPRDIVSRAIDNEMKIWGDDHVWLDCTHLEPAGLKDHFPNVYEHCLQRGIDITRDMIPVVPCVHYSCGGIKVDTDGQSSIDRLYALGEASSTGLHGANRLASNSLIEAAVFSHRAVMHSSKRIGELDFEEKIPDWDYKGTTHLEEMVLITQSQKEVQTIMSNYVGIVRSDLRLDRALVRLEILYKETESLYKKSLVYDIFDYYADSHPMPGCLRRVAVGSAPSD
mgnify:CR=1 FL=1